MTMRTRGKKKTRVGTVVSDKMQKTLVVNVERVYRHPRYEKVVRAVSRCYAHDEKREARCGDMVRIEECRPLSRLKRWRMVEIVKKGRGLRDRAKSEEEVRELQEGLKTEQDVKTDKADVQERVDDAGAER